MEITIDENPKALVVKIEGRLVAACVEEARDIISSRLSGYPAVVFDLSGMTHIDSSGLGLLVQLLQRITTAGGVLRLAAIQPRPRIVFDITKTYRVFDIRETVADAIDSFA